MTPQDVTEGCTPYPWRHHQRQALEAIDRARVGGVRRAWVVLPPGAGKTLVGLEAARRRGRATVVLTPNSAVLTQWASAWDAYGGEPASTSRDVAGAFTALTYQSLATFTQRVGRDRGVNDADAGIDDLSSDDVHDDDDDGAGPTAALSTDARPSERAEPAEPESLVAGLHPHGQALVRRLRELGNLTLILDECHHLLEVWGRLLAEVLDELPAAFVLGLTATPPETMTGEQADLVDDLFGSTLFTASIPAVVREGDLAPFGELAWLTTPTPVESQWLAAQGERFAELTTALCDPAYGSTGFLVWLDQRFGTGLPTDPVLRDASLRMVHAGLLAPTPSTILHEQHRRDPTTDDWALLIGGWVDLLRAGGRDDDVIDRIRRVLPAVGYQLTRTGVRRARSPVDRVLARSEAKAAALPWIVAGERANLGARLRMLVLCDHERAGATLPVELTGVLNEQAGSAVLALARLRESVPDLHPLMVTGSTVAGAPATLEALKAHAGRPDLVVVGDRLEGRWTSRDWVPAVTRFFEEGRSQVLVGTRGLLGEGWDARRISTVVDLTGATTSTAVVQTRGRALRVDPSWPDKVAMTWSVVCVSEDHPRGDQDWRRLVRKHEGFLGVDEQGDIVAGVGHVAAAFSPYAPPPADSFDAVNAGMLERAERRGDVRDAWRVGTPYEDTLTHTLRVAVRAPSTVTRPRRGGDPSPLSEDPAAVVLHEDRVEVRDGRPGLWRPHPVIAVGIVVALVTYLLDLTPAVVIALGLLTMVGLQATVAVDRGRLLAEELCRPPDLSQVARAVADALHRVGLSPVGSPAVDVAAEESGELRCALSGTSPSVSATFAAALDEMVSPLASPRYVVARYVLVGPATNGHGLRAALGVLRPDGEVWHSVPAVLGSTGQRAQLLAHAWDRWVGGGRVLYTGSPEGEGVMVTHRGSDPFAVTTVLRTQWR